MPRAVIPRSAAVVSVSRANHAAIANHRIGIVVIATVVGRRISAAVVATAAVIGRGVAAAVITVTWAITVAVRGFSPEGGPRQQATGHAGKEPATTAPARLRR